eukprot:5441042-Prymnesium_polylepis.2
MDGNRGALPPSSPEAWTGRVFIRGVVSPCIRVPSQRSMRPATFWSAHEGEGTESEALKKEIEQWRAQRAVRSVRRAREAVERDIARAGLHKGGSRRERVEACPEVVRGKEAVDPLERLGDVPGRLHDRGEDKIGDYQAKARQKIKSDHGDQPA